MGAAIYDFWKGRRSITRYEEVRNGKTVNGWRMVVPIPMERDDWKVSCPLNQADNDESGLSVLLRFTDPTRKDRDRRVTSVVRQSMVSPDTSDTIRRFVCFPGEWSEISYSRVTARISAAVFEDDDSRYRLVVFDTISKHHRLFSIEMPAAGGDQVEVRPLMVRGYDAARARINVVFYARKANDDGGYHDFYDCSYEFPVSSGDQAATIKATSWESLSIPSNHRDFDWTVTNPDAGFLRSTNIDDHLAISFDRKNMWQLDTVRNWSDKLRSTADGAKYLDATKSFKSLSSPDFDDDEESRLQYFGKIPRFHYGGALLCRGECGLLQRWIYPPSLKRAAAYAFCRANPSMDCSKLKNVLGFDVFDGIVDGKEIDGPVIYLRNL